MRRDKRGFTLIELVLMIAIIGIMSVLAVALIVSHKETYIEVASQKIRTDIENARGMAMAKMGSVFGVFFDATANTYIVYENDVSNPVKDPLTKQSLIEDFSKFPDVSITGNNYTVEFNYMGSTTAGGGGNVQITDGANSRTIAVTFETGKVIVQ